AAARSRPPVRAGRRRLLRHREVALDAAAVGRRRRGDEHGVDQHVRQLLGTEAGGGDDDVEPGRAHGRVDADGRTLAPAAATVTPTTATTIATTASRRRRLAVTRLRMCLTDVLLFAAE